MFISKQSNWFKTKDITKSSFKFFLRVYKNQALCESRNETERDWYVFCPPGAYCTVGKRDEQILRNYNSADECCDIGSKEVREAEFRVPM